MREGELEDLLMRSYQNFSVADVALKSFPLDVTSTLTIPTGEYSIDQDVVVGKSGSLTLSAGTRLLFAPGKSIEVNGGQFRTLGTEQNPVVLESLEDVYGRSGWAGVSVSDGVSSLAHTLLTGVRAVPSRFGITAKDGEFTNDLFSKGTSAYSVIKAKDSSLSLDNVIISDNTPLTSAIFLLNSKIEMHDSFLRRNKREGTYKFISRISQLYDHPSLKNLRSAGGEKLLAAGLTAVDSTGSIDNTVFDNLNAGGRAVGAVSLVDAPVGIKDSSFTNNRGYLAGGVYVHNPDDKQVMSGNRFVANIGDYGGAVYIGPGLQLGFSNYLMENNDFERNVSRRRKHPDVFSASSRLKVKW